MLLINQFSLLSCNKMGTQIQFLFPSFFPVNKSRFSRLIVPARLLTTTQTITKNEKIATLINENKIYNHHLTRVGVASALAGEMSKNSENLKLNKDRSSLNLFSSISTYIKAKY